MGSRAELEGVGERGGRNHIIGLTRYRAIAPSGPHCGQLRQGSGLEEKEDEWVYIISMTRSLFKLPRDLWNKSSRVVKG